VSKEEQDEAQNTSASQLIERGETVFLPTQEGEFMLTPFRDLTTGLEHIALTKGEWTEEEAVLCRVHSSCMTGDVFGSLRCECGEQLTRAMQMIEKEGKGIVVYMNQEGRGIGLMNKIRAYKLQEQGEDTVEANIHLGFRPDERDYGVGAQILRAMGAKKLKLMTNNPVKRVGLESYGIEIIENVPIEIKPNRFNERYMRTKKEKMHHDLKMV
jgi:3,4-dihydroxy 2-butanone 4-phosphate synthase/GTP cyclohydrolase II